MIVFADNVIADRLQALTRAIDADAPLPGLLWLLDAAGSVIASVPFLLPSSDGVENGALALRIAEKGIVSTSGTAASAHIVSGSGKFVAALDVGIADSGAAVEIDSLTLYSGGEVVPALAALAEA